MSQITFENPAGQSKTFFETGRQDIFIMHLMRPGAVGYLIIKPSEVDGMVMRVTALTDCLKQSEQQAVSSILLMLGIVANHDGFEYLCYAIPMYRRAPAKFMTKVLYPDIAKAYNRRVDARQVEHAIRTTICKAWQRRDDKVWQMFFPVGADGKVPKPSNGYFIARLARLLDIWDVGSDDVGNK